RRFRRVRSWGRFAHKRRITSRLASAPQTSGYRPGRPHPGPYWTELLARGDHHKGWGRSAQALKTATRHTFQLSARDCAQHLSRHLCGRAAVRERMKGKKSNPIVITKNTNRYLELIARLARRPEHERTGTYFAEGVRALARAVEEWHDIHSVMYVPSLLNHAFARRLVERLQGTGVE